jgi:hypothetical protein
MDKHGLSGLSEVLQKTNSFIAGSYAVPIEDLMKGQTDPVDDRDIDIWMIMGEEDEFEYSKRLSLLARFFAAKGYSWPQVVGVRHMEGDIFHYKRMEHSILKMYTLKCETRIAPPIQILVLTPLAGSTPEEIVRKFDLTLMMRWYDGKELTILPEAARALENRVLEVNVSQEFEKQNMREWHRTARRFQKYTARNFKLMWQADPLDRLLLDSAAISIYSPYDCVLSIQLLERWNKEIRAFAEQLPYLGVTMCPPATTLSHLRVFCSRNNSRFSLNPDPRLPWKELTTGEQESALPVLVPDKKLAARNVYIDIDSQRYTVNAAVLIAKSIP